MQARLVRHHFFLDPESNPLLEDMPAKIGINQTTPHLLNRRKKTRVG